MGFNSGLRGLRQLATSTRLLKYANGAVRLRLTVKFGKLLFTVISHWEWSDWQRQDSRYAVPCGDGNFSIQYGDHKGYVDTAGVPIPGQSDRHVKVVDRVKNQSKIFNFIYPFSGRMWRRDARWLVSEISRQRGAPTCKGRNIQWRSFSRGYFDTWRWDRHAVPRRRTPPSDVHNIPKERRSRLHRYDSLKLIFVCSSKTISYIV